MTVLPLSRASVDTLEMMLAQHAPSAIGEAYRWATGSDAPTRRVVGESGAARSKSGIAGHDRR